MANILEWKSFVNKLPESIPLGIDIYVRGEIVLFGRTVKPLKVVIFNKDVYFNHYDEIKSKIESFLGYPIDLSLWIPLPSDYAYGFVKIYDKGRRVSNLESHPSIGKGYHFWKKVVEKLQSMV